VLTKADKLKPKELTEIEDTIANASKRHGAAHPEILATSALSGQGIPELRASLAALALA
jgi:GTP-binding protein